MFVHCQHTNNDKARLFVSLLHAACVLVASLPLVNHDQHVRRRPTAIFQSTLVLHVVVDSSLVLSWRRAQSRRVVARLARHIICFDDLSHHDGMEEAREAGERQ